MNLRLLEIKLENKHWDRQLKRNIMDSTLQINCLCRWEKQLRRDFWEGYVDFSNGEQFATVLELAATGRRRYGLCSVLLYIHKMSDVHIKCLFLKILYL